MWSSSPSCHKNCALWTWTSEPPHVSSFVCCCPMLLVSFSTFTSALQSAKHSHIHFFSSESQAAQQVNRRGKVTGPQSTSTGSPTFMGCHRESAMVDLGPLIPTPLLFLTCLSHFTLSMFSLPRGPEKKLSSHGFQGDMGCFYSLSIPSFLWGAIPSQFLLVLMSSRDGLRVSTAGPEPLLPHGVSWIGNLHMKTKRLQVFHYSHKRERWLVSVIEIPKHPWCCPSLG